MVNKSIVIRASLTTAIIFILFGGIFLFIIGKKVLDEKTMEKYLTAETVAEVVDYSSYRKDGTIMYSIIYGFTINGEYYESISRNSSSFKPIVGKTAVVRYNPENPSQYLIAGEEISLFLVFVIAIFPLVGLLLLVKVFVKPSEYVIIKGIYYYSSEEAMLKHIQKLEFTVEQSGK